MPESTAAQRLLLAFDMFDTAVAIMEQNLRRRHPTETPTELRRRLESWLRERPGAEQGDAEGVPASRSRFR